MTVAVLALKGLVQRTEYHRTFHASIIFIGGTFFTFQESFSRYCWLQVSPHVSTALFLVLDVSQSNSKWTWKWKTPCTIMHDHASLKFG
jgi:hypothetical protein